MNQIGEKYGLPVRTSFSTTRSFFIQMKLEGLSFPEGKLPSEFIKVRSTHKYNIEMKTLVMDLFFLIIIIKINCEEKGIGFSLNLLYS